MIKVGIYGISGYSGCALLEILLKHNDVRLTYASANNTQGKVSEIWPHLASRTSLDCVKFTSQKAIELCDLIFLAVPHGTSMAVTPLLLRAKKRVIDLSGDYRLSSVGEYKKWYEISHTDRPNLGKAVYGLPELFREKIKSANLVANPGCYPTAAILSLAPLLATHANAVNSIIIDAKSGVSGAGKKMTSSLMFAEVNENFKAYKVLNHQHTPEIEQYASRLAGKTLNVTFVPHLLPVNRGILETIYVSLGKSFSLSQIASVYKKFYKTEKFVRVLAEGLQPELKNVVGTNFCDIGLALDEKKRLLVITAAIDNLLKGAAGQAVQNMNIMYHLNETEGLL